MTLKEHCRLHRLRPAIVVIVLALQACAADGGQVIDSATGKPLAGVHVIARWDGQRLAGAVSKHDCFKVEATTTDASGRYSLPATSWNLNPLLSDRRRTLIFYKRGYKAPEPRASDDEARVPMSPDERIGLERIRYVNGTAAGADCGSEPEQRARLLPYYREVYEEVKAIAKSPEDLGALSGALFRVELLDLGSDTALANDARRRREWGVK